MCRYLLNFYPGRFFKNFRASKSRDRGTLWSSGTSCAAFWSSKVVKGSVGELRFILKEMCKFLLPFFSLHKGLLCPWQGSSLQNFSDTQKIAPARGHTFPFIARLSKMTEIKKLDPFLPILEVASLLEWCSTKKKEQEIKCTIKLIILKSPSQRADSITSKLEARTRLSYK